MSAISRGRSRGAQRPARPGRVGGAISRGARIAGGLIPRRGAGGPRRHHRGISATELRGFRKVVGLLRRVGMVPKHRRPAPRRV